MNTAQSILENERRHRRLKLFHLASVNNSLTRHPERSEGPAVSSGSIFGWQCNFDIEREARLRRQQRGFRFKNFLREHGWELNAILIFFLLIGVAVFFMTRTLAALDRVHELQREIQILRALAN